VTWREFGVIASLIFVCGCSARADSVAKPVPTVVVLEPGAEPRQRLRYEPAPGLAEEVETSTKLRITNTFTNTVLETGQRSADYPTSVIRGRLQVTGQSAEGHALVSFAVEDVRTLGDVVDPRLRQRVDEELHRLRGVQAAFRLLPTGELADVKVDAPNASQEIRERVSSLASSLDEMFVRFPEADIGIGATWQIETHSTISGVKWTKKATYQLRELTDGQATVDVSVAMRAASQALRVEPNRTTTLESGEGTTSGQAFVPRHGLVTSGSSQTTTEASLLIVDRHLRISSTVRTEMLSAVKRLDF
jgi:hypothetical protein